MTEQQKFNLIARIEDIEIREYLSCVLADVQVQAGIEAAGNIGFRPLVTYISQNSIAMTAPVLHEQEPGGWTVSFVMPHGMELDQLPLPQNTQVSLRQSPRHFAAAISFSGHTRMDAIKRQEARLREVLNKHGIRVIGELQVARFDPPWKPGFMRHNEVILKIDYQPKK